MHAYFIYFFLSLLICFYCSWIVFFPIFFKLVPALTFSGDVWTSYIHHRTNTVHIILSVLRIYFTFIFTPWSCWDIISLLSLSMGYSGGNYFKIPSRFWSLTFSLDESNSRGNGFSRSSCLHFYFDGSPLLFWSPAGCIDNDTLIQVYPALLTSRGQDFRAQAI